MSNEVQLILSILGGAGLVVGATWKLSSILNRLDSKIDLVAGHVKDHCDDLTEVKNDVKTLIRGRPEEQVRRAGGN